jgi:hypothetical protein
MMTFGHPIIYRGWEIDRYRQPDKCYYAYAPDYDGRTEWHTQCAPTLRELCDDIDDAIEARDSDCTATAAANGDLPVPQDCQARCEAIAQTHPKAGQHD